MVAQDQALSIGSKEAGVYHSSQDPRCRLCKDAPETFQHIIAECKILVGTTYPEKNNQVAGVVSRPANVAAECGFEVPKSQWEEPPRRVENNRTIILWDFKLQTDKQLLANQQDIVVVDNEQKRAVVIGVTIPGRRRKEWMWKVKAHVLRW